MKRIGIEASADRVGKAKGGRLARTVVITPGTCAKVRVKPPSSGDLRSKLPPLPVVFHPGYEPRDGIGEHVMPIRKFGYVASAIRETGIPVSWVTPEPIAEGDIAAVHEDAYVDAIRTGQPRRLAEASTFRWSPGLYESVRLTSGGEYAAALEALRNGEFAFAPVSGFHHARPDRGDGYCTFNGLAITAKRLLAEGRVERVLIVDNDFHYGNGTAHACAGDPRIFTFSLHGQGWDYRPESETNRYVELPPGGSLREYLDADLEVAGIVERFQPDLILYQAGMDPLQTDSLSRGHFRLSHRDLKARDRWIFELARESGVPLVANLAGGYSYDIHGEPSPVVAGHLNTFLAALEVYRGFSTELEVPEHAQA